MLSDHLTQWSHKKGFVKFTMLIDCSLVLLGYAAFPSFFQIPFNLLNNLPWWFTFSHRRCKYISSSDSLISCLIKVSNWFSIEILLESDPLFL